MNVIRKSDQEDPYPVPVIVARGEAYGAPAGEPRQRSGAIPWMLAGIVALILALAVFCLAGGGLL